MTVVLRSNWRGIDRELDRLAAMPTPEMIAGLDRVLSAGFAATQASVHVVTGSLKSSGEKSSEFHRATKEWVGEIAYGGDSLGPNNPVDYAIYEAARGTGGAGGESDARGNHNFMAALTPYQVAFLAQMKKGLTP